MAGRSAKKGLDVLLYDLGEVLVAKGITEKGKTLMEEAEEGEPVDEASRKAAEEAYCPPA